MTINVPERKGIKTTRLKKGTSVWKDPVEVSKMKKDEEIKRPRISVIIPNQSQYVLLAQAYNSVWEQLGKYDHIIIADQGSIDGTSPEMFAENEQVTYVRYPKTSPMEIINFAIINVVQTKYVLLLDPRSTLPKGLISSLKGSLSQNRFVVCKNKGTDNVRTRNIDYKNSYSGYAFQKNDAIKAGLFDIKFAGMSSALFVEKMKKMGIDLVIDEILEITTKYKKLVDDFNSDYLQEKKNKYTDYDNLKLNLEPMSFILIDKQKEQLNQLLKQLILPEDEMQVLNVASPNKFNDVVAKSKHDNIIVVKADADELLTYDPITNLRLLFDKHRVLCTNLEPRINCMSFHKGIYVRPKGDMTVDEIIRFIAKKARKSIELTKVIEHHSRTKRQETMKGGVMVSVDEPSTVDAIRRKKGEVSIWVPTGKDSIRLKGIKKAGPRPGISRVGIKNYSMKWKNVESLPKIPGIETRRPKILFISDVEGWAWHYKSIQLKKYLSNEFDIDIIWLLGPGASRIKPRSYDLYVTFGYSYIDYLKDVSPRKKITGITAHRPHSILVPQMRKAAVAHANSIMLYEELKTMHNIVYYVPNGVDADLFYPEIPIPDDRNNIVVGHVGKLSPMKGQEDYIKPAIERAKAIPFFHFNDYTNALPLDQMPSLYQNMDVFIVASKEDGTPNPALEAAACGRPIISNAIGNMPEFIKDGYNGFLVDKNIDAYVRKIRWFKNNRDALIEMGKNARETVEKGWTWAIQSENYRKMFKEVLGINESSYSR